MTLNYLNMLSPKSFFSLFITATITIFLSICLPLVTNGEKPTLPLEIEARLLNNPSTEGMAKIKVTLTSSIYIPTISVYCKLPQGTGLSKGKERWEGAIVKDKPEEIIYFIPVAGDKYYQIEFEATMTLNHVRGTKYAFVEINPLYKKNEPSKKLKTKRLPDGKKVIEFKGE